MSLERIVEQLGRTPGIESVFVLDAEGGRLAGSGPLGGGFLDEATADLQFLLDAASELVGQGSIDLQFRQFALRVVRAAPYGLGVLARVDSPTSVVDLAVRVASRQLVRVPVPAPSSMPGRDSLDEMDETTLPSAGASVAPRHQRPTAPPSTPAMPPLPPSHPSSRRFASEPRPSSAGAIDPRTGRPAVSRQPAASQPSRVSPWARSAGRRKKKAGGIWGK